MALTLNNSAKLAGAALAMLVAAAPMQSAEARYYRGGALAAGIVGGAILGGALLARPAYGYYGRPAYYGGPAYVEESECRVVRRRVFDEYRGRWVVLRRTICD